MGLRRYILFSLVYIAAIGVYVYTFQGESYEITFFGIPVALPVAVWIVVPLVILFLASTAHIFFYSLIDFFKLRSVKKDQENLMSAFKSLILGEEKRYEFKTSWFDRAYEVLSVLKPDIEKKEVRLKDEQADEALGLLRKVYSGEVVELKKYKLSEKSPLFIKNEENKLKSNPSYAETILKKCTDKKSKLCKEAYLEYAKTASLENLKKFDFPPSREVFDILIERFAQSDKNALQLEIQDIKDYITNLGYNKDDFISLAKRLKTKMNPDGLMMLFEKLHEDFDEATEAYLYILFELQMIDKIREIVESTTEDEYVKFKKLLFLRDSGKTFDIDIFI